MIEKECENMGARARIRCLLSEYGTETIRKTPYNLNKKLGQAEQIKRFRLVQDEWSPLRGELSPTLKLKRKFLIEKYSNILKEIFSIENSNITELI